jgi:hypothetical protein
MGKREAADREAVMKEVVRGTRAIHRGTDAVRLTQR